ncbi:Glycoside hydrolase family 3 [Phytophthora cactorum]|nr:Glycoside hydrolase family 3 [Phytophthora cactorum]
MLALLFVLAVASCFALPTNADIPRASVGEESQKLPFCDPSLSTYLRVEDLLSRLPLQEKATLLTARATPRGNMSSIGLPEYNWGANCVHGVQSTCGTNCPTSFRIPSTSAPSSTHKWCPTWLKSLDGNYVLCGSKGPERTTKAAPTSDSTAETPSEDPLVNSKYGVAYTRGLQEGKREDPRFLQAVVTIKHYAAYSYENYGGVNRMEFDAIVSPYDFTDTYFPAFRSSIVDGNAMGVMCSYNSVNGIPMCANNALEKTLLRDTLGFDGYITSDSGAVEAISDMHHYADSQCEAARLAILAGTDINSGKSYEACLKDLALRHTLKLRFKLGLFDPIEDQPYWNVTPSDVNTAEAKELSLKRPGMLPLTKGVKLAVIGPHAKSKRGLLGNYLGQMCRGDYDEAISAMNGASSTTFARGCDIKNSSTAGFDEAVTATQNADTVVLFLGIDKTVEGEVGDRDNIELPSIQMKLLKRIRAVGKPTVLVLINGGVIGAEKIIHQTDALSMDMTAYPGRTYRYFKGEPVFPFGWGLSYTTFSLSVDNGTTTRSATSTNSSSGSLVTAVEISNSANATISVVVSNDGDVAGFCYLLNMQLFDYQRVSLEPSDSTRVSFTVQRSDLSLVDESGNSVSYPGSYEIIVSNGVREHLSFSVEVGDAEKVIQSRVQPFPAFGNSANSAASARASSQGSRVILCLVALIIALL